LTVRANCGKLQLHIFREELVWLKNILITGRGSYIGSSFETYLGQFGDAYRVTALDLKNENWKFYDFSGYDAVFHVAGIAHADLKNADELYFRVNRDLAVKTAAKAKSDGVKQFIFMSTMKVYPAPTLKKPIEITAETQPAPNSSYGLSKLQAEQSILAMEDASFRAVILRPPLVYGPGCKGNYPKLSEYGQKLSVFPDVENRRSMLFIENLCEFVRLMIENNERGIFFPQNGEYICTSKIVADIAAFYGRDICLIKMGSLLKAASVIFKKLNNAFSTYTYNQNMSAYRQDYRVADLAESVMITEGRHT
jgi:UDP-glucose 4-epimerase